MAHRRRKNRSRIDEDASFEGGRYPNTWQTRADDGDGVAEAFGTFSRLVGPPERLDSIDWIEQHRRLSPEASAEPGPFRFDRIPYGIDPQRAVLDPTIPEVVLCWAGQCAKTEIATLNPLLYWSVVAPGPALVVCPDWKLAHSLSCDRIDPMLRDSRVPGVNLEDDRIGGPGADHSMFRKRMGNGMTLSVTNSLSSTGLAQRPIRYLIFEEVSKLPAEARGRAIEGDVVALAKIRTSTFGKDAKIVYSSSPTEYELCRVTALYEASTRHRYYSKCPRGHLQVLALAEMNFADATCKCQKCGRSYPQWAWTETPGKWIADNPGHPRAGYLLAVWPSPFVEWPTVYDEWRQAIALKKAGDWSSYRATCGNRLAEAVKRRTEESVVAGQAEKLRLRREIYPEKLSNDIKVIVAAVDTQDDWLQYLIVGFGPRRECWMLESGQILGRLDLSTTEMAADLFRLVVNRTWTREDGRLMRVTRMIQDCGGHLSPFVCGMLKPYWPRAMPSRGSALGNAELWRLGEEKSVHRARIILVNSSLIKDAVFGMLTIPEPGPGFIHFPVDEDGSDAAGFNQEFFEQLVESETKQLVLERGLRHWRWKQIRDRNESFDCFVLALVALDSLKLALDTMAPIVMKQPQSPTEPVQGQEQTATATATATTTQPRNPRQRPRTHWWRQSAGYP